MYKYTHTHVYTHTRIYTHTYAYIYIYTSDIHENPHVQISIPHDASEPSEPT